MSTKKTPERWRREEGREVFAVPGEITSALSAGTNALLRLPEAEALLARLRDAPAGADALARAAGIEAGAASAALVELELAGLVAEAEDIYRAMVLPL